MLEDDAFRQGGAVHIDQLLRVCEKKRLTAEQTVAVRSRLGQRGVEIEGTEDDEPGPEEQETQALQESAEPSAEQVLSAVGAYVKDARKFDLLSAEEETHLMRRVRAGERAAAAIAAGAPESPELDELIANGQTARERFLGANLRLVIHIAKKFKRVKSLAFEDLVQEGNIGLMRAVDKFDHTLGWKFSTYATWWILQGISRAAADKDRLIRIPVHMLERISKVKKARHVLKREQGGLPPSSSVLAEHLQWPVEKVQALLDLDRDPVSLDAPVNSQTSECLGDFIPCTRIPGPEQVAEARELQRDVDRALEGFTEQEKDIITRRYGQEHTLEQIGQDYDVTRERIRQIQERVLSRLRHPARAQVLADHYPAKVEESEKES